MKTTLRPTSGLPVCGSIVRATAVIFACGVVATAASAGARQDAAGNDPPIVNTGPGQAVDASQRAALRTRYNDALKVQQYQEAELAAKQLLQHEISEGNTETPAYADALCALAYVQRRLGETEPALTNYAAAIRSIESNDGMLSERLATPLYGAGMTSLEANRADVALSFFERALHTIHVNFGPHALEQAGIIEGQIAAYNLLDDVEDGKNSAMRLFAMYAREYGEDSAKMVPVTLKVADVYGRLGLTTDERDAYEHAVELIRDRQGDGSLELVDPYIAIARTYVYQRRHAQFVPSSTQDTGETWLRRALQIVEDNEQADWQMETRVKLALADYYTISDEARNARKYYEQVWHLLSDDAEHLAERRKNLEQVVPLVEADSGNLEAMRDNLPTGSGAIAGTGHMKATYVVDADGHVSDVHIIESKPSGQEDVEAHLKRSLERFIYRPRYENGAPVASIDQLFSYTFAYEKPDNEPPAKKTQP